MNLQETAQALALAQAFDRRTVGEMDVRAWHSIVGGFAAADVMEVIRRHYSVNTEWIMPAHLVVGVEQIGRERRSAETEWAPGQHGVRKEDAMPELPRGGRLTAADMSPEVVDLLSRLRAVLPDVPREQVFGREGYWEREQRNFQRQRAAEPNPYYRPPFSHECLIDDGRCIAAGHQEHEERLRNVCRAESAHDSGVHAEGCPDYVHQHRASCHGAIGELLCGHVPGKCRICGCKSEDIFAHIQDYPNGSCA